MRGVLFDFAGTLFAPRPAADWVREAARRSGVEVDAGAVERLAGEYEAAGMPGGPYPASVPGELADAYARRDLSPAAHRRAYVALMSAVDGPAPAFAEALYAEVTRPEHWVPYADARDAVRRLAAEGVRVGLISNVGFDLRPILRAHGFGALAEHCTLSFEHGAAKPDPALFAAAVRDLGTPAAETLMVGDHPEADGGAVFAGCPTLLLPMSPPGAVHGLGAVLRVASPALELRAAEPSDEPFLTEMLRRAAGWRTDELAPMTPELERYVRGFGRPGDHGVVALRDGSPVAAAWYRTFDAGEPGYGFFAPGVPELALAVAPYARRAGVATALLLRLIADAAVRGLDGLSLSVGAGNPARDLYERHGFAKTAERGEAWTMLRALRAPA